MHRQVESNNSLTTDINIIKYNNYTMDTHQLLKYSLLSKILNDNTTTALFSNSLYLCGFAFIYILYQIIPPLLPQNINEIMIDSVKEYIKYILPAYEKDESCINIPTHKKLYYTHGRQSAPTETVKTIFSLRFKALNYFLQDKKYQDISSLVEIVKIENDRWGHDIESEYILFPLNNSRIQIDEIENIWFEVIVNTEKASENEDGKKINFSKIVERNYIFKITTPGKKNIKLLNTFIDNAVEQYTKNVINKKEKIIIEYIHSHKDDEDKMKLTFKEYPFKSNKFLDKNIFFAEKDELIAYIDQFSIYNTNNESYGEYERAGLTHKAAIVLHGKPGTGKTSIIRGILNRTGRIGVLVQWSKIKTCSEFTSLLYDLNINGKKYALNELCFIFEDFGANQNPVLKTRKPNDPDSFDINEFTIISDFNKDIDTSVIEKDIDKISNTDLKYSIQLKLQKYKNQIKSYTSALHNISKPVDDELTMDCVLNTIDGIIELHDAMLIFTDNYIEDIDPAFMRAGRINYNLELKNASIKVIQDMIQNKFGISNVEIYANSFKLMKDYCISPADVQKICVKYAVKDIELCLAEIITYMN